jgi:phosphate:Na+ symporter
VLAAIGATPNARRMAAAHVLFNVITGIVALIILPLMLALLHALQAKLDLESGAPMLLALFHTSFNLLGVALLWPFTTLLVRQLERRFRLKDEDEARPRYLDSTIVAMPVLALQALTLELAHIGHIVARMAHMALAGEAPLARLERDANTTEQLIDAVGEFTALMRRGNLPVKLAEVLPNAIGISRYFRDTTALALAISRMEPATMVLGLAEPSAQFRGATEAVIDAATEPESFDEAACLRSRQALSRQYEELKSQTLKEGSLGRVPVRQVVELVEMFKDTERMASYLVKAAGLLAAMRAVAANEPAAEPGGDRAHP